MYSNKENVNILTALLVAFGIRHAVVCPGSRNAPIVHNFNECPEIQCYPVTDERSAGFYALGMAQALQQPVVVCVTSGSALLNVAPAAAEAKYQHVPLVIVSADRPLQWIDQLDGQTLPQTGALGLMVAKSVSLPEPHDDDERWYCNRLVNEALLALPACVHINVPVSEPLFCFTTGSLPRQRKIERFMPGTDYDCLRPAFVDALLRAERPMIVMGQSSPYDFSGQDLGFLFSHVIVLHESLAPFPSVSHFDEVLSTETQLDDLLPDFVIYAGGTLVSKRLKRFLRRAVNAQVWRISPTGDVEDTFQNLHGIVVGDAEFVLQSLNNKLCLHRLPGMDYRRRWLSLLTRAGQHAKTFEPVFSQMAVVRAFEQHLPKEGVAVHYANSSAVRLANIYASHHVWCNRGVNGIEGSLSTAAGFSLVFAGKVFCVIGDLSFFYDQNALWNQSLAENFRILLLNNGKGGIFNMLPGLEQSPARDRLVSAAHETSAEGVCLQNHVVYMKATDMQQAEAGIACLLETESERPILLEVFTDDETDSRVFQDYIGNL